MFQDSFPDFLAIQKSFIFLTFWYCGAKGHLASSDNAGEETAMEAQPDTTRAGNALNQLINSCNFSEYESSNSWAHPSFEGH